MGAVLAISKTIIGLFGGNSTAVEDVEDYYVPCFRDSAYTSNSRHSSRVPILNNFMKALADPNIHIIGVFGSSHDVQDCFLPKVRRRIDRDKVFDVVLSVTISKKANVKKIQDEIAGQLGFNFNEKSEGERADELLDRIKKENKILIILYDLFKELDLGKVGIPFGADHRGCKILISSSSEEMFLSNPMRTHRNFIV